MGERTGLPHCQLRADQFAKRAAKEKELRAVATGQKKIQNPET